MPRSRNAPLVPGQQRRHVLLGTTAIYDVLAIEGDLIRVAVVAAPQLEPGVVMTLTREAVESMEVVSHRVVEGAEPANESLHIDS